jgi:hypothetical protein
MKHLWLAPCHDISASCIQSKEDQEEKYFPPRGGSLQSHMEKIMNFNSNIENMGPETNDKAQRKGKTISNRHISFCL